MKLLLVFFLVVNLKLVKSTVIDCSFAVSFENFYSCTNINLNIEKNFVELSSANGEHLNGMSNDKVAIVYFLSSGMRSLPRGIFKIFKNLSKYIVSGQDTVDEFLNSNALINGDFKGASSLHTLLFISVILEHLRPKVFEGAENLVHLTLEACRITTIDKDAFVGLKKLQSLGMKFNYIATLNPNTFSGLAELQHLLLSGNYIEEIKRDHFRGLKKLIRISLIGNRLEEIDQNITGLPNLEHFYLDQNLCVDTHFGTDGVPFSKFKKEVAQCSRKSVDKEKAKLNLEEIKELEKEVKYLQKLVEKYKNTKCENKADNLIIGQGPAVLKKRSELP